MRVLSSFVLATAALAQPPTTPTVQEIVQRSLERDMRNVRALDDYTYELKNTELSYDGSGRVKKSETTVEEVLQIDGTRYRRVIERDGKPLSANDARKERDKMDRELARRKAESPGQREKRIASEKKRQQEMRVMREDVGRAFDFRLMGEEAIQGVKCWKVNAEPKRAGFHGKSDMGKRVLPKMHGTLWISQANYEWLRVEAEALDTIRFGWVLASLAKGSTFKMEQGRVAGDLWHPRRMEVRLQARGLMMKFNVGGEMEFRNFRKFATETRMLSEDEHKKESGSK